MVTYTDPYSPTSGDTLDVTSYNSSMAIIYSALNAFPGANVSGVNAEMSALVTSGIRHAFDSFKFFQKHLLHASMSGVYSKWASGLAYVKRLKAEKTSGNILMSASKWNYVFIDSSGTIDKVVVANGSTDPSDPSNGMWLYSVRMSGNSLKEYANLAPYRNETANDSSYSVFTGVPIHPTYRRNVKVGWTNTTTVTVPGSTSLPAELCITNKNSDHPVFCRNTDNVTATTTTLDTGTIAARTRYYVYAYPKIGTDTEFDIVISLNATAPKNFPWSRKIGYVYSNGASQFEEFYTTKDGGRYDFAGELPIALNGASAKQVVAAGAWTSYILRHGNDASGRSVPEDATHVYLRANVGAAAAGGSLRMRGGGTTASGIALVGGAAASRQSYPRIPIGFSSNDPIIEFYEVSGDVTALFTLIGFERSGG